MRGVAILNSDDKYSISAFIRAFLIATIIVYSISEVRERIEDKSEVECEYNESVKGEFQMDGIISSNSYTHILRYTSMDMAKSVVHTRLVQLSPMTRQQVFNDSGGLPRICY
jgi:hypothetical protein